MDLCEEVMARRKDEVMVGREVGLRHCLPSLPSIIDYRMMTGRRKPIAVTTQTLLVSVTSPRKLERRETMISGSFHTKKKRVDSH
jgi:hypothetical protein